MIDISRVETGDFIQLLGEIGYFKVTFVSDKKIKLRDNPNNTNITFNIIDNKVFNQNYKINALVKKNEIVVMEADLDAWFIALGQIGEGAYSRIMKITPLKDIFNLKKGEFYALKFIDKQYTDHINIINEIEIMKILNNDHIIKHYHEFMWLDGYDMYIFCIITEYIPGDNLANILEDKNIIITDDIKLNYMKQMTEGVKYINDHNIIHNDIKTDNIMITPSGKIKIIDFGLSCSTSDIAIMCRQAYRGTPLYMSPEIFSGFIENKQIDITNLFYQDIWSLGILFYKLVYDHFPPEIASYYNIYRKNISDKKMYIVTDIVYKKDRISFPYSGQTYFEDIIYMMLQKDMTMRSNIESVIYNLNQL